MKKLYIHPTTEVLALQADRRLLAGSTGDINRVTISDTETISDVSEFGSRRRGNVWDEAEYDEE